MGTEDGRFELWSWPIKWLHDLELFFQVPKYVEPLPGHALARSVVERPEGVTIEYAYETFTVKQHVFVPLDLPAVIMLLEVDAVRPLDVIARWTPDVHFAWPAALGGQYMVWQQDVRAFLFSESRRKITVTPAARLDQGPFPTPIERVPRVDEEECVGCNLCWLVCPVESCITMERVDTGRAAQSWAQRTGS